MEWGEEREVAPGAFKIFRGYFVQRGIKFAYFNSEHFNLVLNNIQMIEYFKHV